MYDIILYDMILYRSSGRPVEPVFAALALEEHIKNIRKFRDVVFEDVVFDNNSSD